MVVSFFITIFVPETKNRNIMKKADIILEYNNLYETLKPVVDEYRSKTGEEIGGGGRMDESFMRWSKEELECELIRRQNFIKSLREKIAVFDDTEKLKSSPEGSAFIENLNVISRELQKDLDDMALEFERKFNDLLGEIGMKDWNICPSRIHKVFPEYRSLYFPIYKTDMEYCQLRLSIELTDKGWVMTVNSAINGGSSIVERDEQYYRFKGYITICDNCDRVIRWIETEYMPMASRVYNIREEIRKNDRAIENPYEAWLKANE